MRYRKMMGSSGIKRRRLRAAGTKKECMFLRHQKKKKERFHFKFQNCDKYRWKQKIGSFVE
jgi:hypothetical protein